MRLCITHCTCLLCYIFIIIISFSLECPVFLWEHIFEVWPQGSETWLWRMKARGSQVLHEEPLCAISKPTKLSPLAVVWTLLWWELVCLVYLFVVMVSEGVKPSHPIGLGFQSSWRTGHTKAQCDGVITVTAHSSRMCQLSNWQLHMVAMSCSPLVTVPWNHPL